MANPADVQSSKACRRILGKRGIDVSMAEVRVMHGVCHVRGVVSPIPGKGIENLRDELQNACGLIRRFPGIREVAIDVAYLGGKA